LKKRRQSTNGDARRDKGGDCTELPPALGALGACRLRRSAAAAAAPGGSGARLSALRLRNPALERGAADMRQSAAALGVRPARLRRPPAPPPTKDYSLTLQALFAVLCLSANGKMRREMIQDETGTAWRTETHAESARTQAEGKQSDGRQRFCGRQPKTAGKAAQWQSSIMERMSFVADE
jgi:hypothetical protein